MIIGKSKCPHVLHKRTGQQLGFDFLCNDKAWMTRVFFDLLSRFSNHIRKHPDRKILLLLDNCTAHDNMDIILELSNVTVLFLPTQKTSRL